MTSKTDNEEQIDAARGEAEEIATSGYLEEVPFNPALHPYQVTLIWATPQGDQQIGYMARVSNSKATPDDPASKLISYLLRNHHWSPFEMANMCVEIRTQRDISAQILRHRSFSFQEFSTRYAEVEELLAVTECRFQDAKNRQNSFSVDQLAETQGGNFKHDTEDGTSWLEGESIEATVSYFDAVINETRVRSLEAYQELLRRGVAKEVARRILPIGLMPTRMYMNGTVRSWLHYLSERTKDGVQKEHRAIACEIAWLFSEHFPDVFAAAVAEGLLVEVPE